MSSLQPHPDNSVNHLTLRAVRRVLNLSLFLVVFIFNACQINNTPISATYLRVEGNAKLLTYSRVVITMGDSLGNMHDTLFNDSLSSLDKLNRLPVENYNGEKTTLGINGYYQKILAYSEKRFYDGKTQKVLSLDIIKNDNPAQSAAVTPTTPVNPTQNRSPSPAPSPNSTLPPASPANIDTATRIDTAKVNVFHLPTFKSFPHDTVVSIRDTVYLNTEVADPDGDLFRYTWDCNGDGLADDSGSLTGYTQKVGYGKRFKKPGNYTCRMNIWDKGGRTAFIEDAIQVLLDPPTAYAGKDTTVTVGTKINLNATADDRFDPIISRGWKIGDQPFKIILQSETVEIAPSTPQDLMFILTVMDLDSLTASDTLMVKVVANPADSLIKPQISPLK